MVKPIKVAFIGLESSEKKYFENALGDEYELSFIHASEWQKIDPATEILSVFVSFEVTRDVFDALPNLKLVACRSTGYNNVDLETAGARGIKVANTPGYGASSVAEYAFALTLTLSRKLPAVMAETYDANPDRRVERGFDLNGKTIGIVGLGAIGKGAAAIARGFGMRVLGFDPFMDQTWARNNGVEPTDIDQLLNESDVVTLHIPFTEDNRHFINDQRFKQMKKGALLINTARGELVDTVSLVRELRRSHLGGAALDVVEEEYLLDPDELIKLATENADQEACISLRHAVALLALERMSNVIVTNHNAFNTNEALERINNMTVENIIGFTNDDKIYSVEKRK
jgi:D-lactate dehydrogenase